MEEFVKSLWRLDTDRLDDSLNGKHCLDYAIIANDEELFVYLLEKGANPFCAIKSILKNLAFLEILLSRTEGGTGIDSVLFPYTATKLIALRGRERTTFHKLLLKYDFPISTGKEWREQTMVECSVNFNDVGRLRLGSVEECTEL